MKLLDPIRFGFPETLRRVRHERDLSQQELADLLHVHLRQLSKYENGHASPTLGKVQRMCEVLGVSADELIMGRSPKARSAAAAAASGPLRNPLLADRLRTLEQIASHAEIRSIVTVLDAFIAKLHADHN